MSNLNDFRSYLENFLNTYTLFIEGVLLPNQLFKELQEFSYFPVGRLQSTEFNYSQVFSNGLKSLLVEGNSWYGDFIIYSVTE
jgi:hypothetical protein